MPIIDKINEAEKQAQEIKENARNEVALMLDEVNKNNNNKVKEMTLKNNLEVEKLYNETKTKVLELTKEYEEQVKLVNNSTNKLAESHLDETVDFIIKKVIDS